MAYFQEKSRFTAKARNASVSKWPTFNSQDMQDL